MYHARPQYVTGDNIQPNSYEPNLSLTLTHFSVIYVFIFSIDRNYHDY